MKLLIIASIFIKCIFMYFQNTKYVFCIVIHFSDLYLYFVLWYIFWPCICILYQNTFSMYFAHLCLQQCHTGGYPKHLPIWWTSILVLHLIIFVVYLIAICQCLGLLGIRDIWAAWCKIGSLVKNVKNLFYMMRFVYPFLSQINKHVFNKWIN